jgi:DNA-damage-inducible protein D
MEEKNSIKLFMDKRVRVKWDAEKEDYYFSIVDVIAVLTESINPTDYLKKLRKRDQELGKYLGTNCPQIKMLTETGKIRLTRVGNTKDIFRLIQSIPSPKAESFFRSGN